MLLPVRERNSQPHFLDCVPARYMWLRLGLWWQTSIPVFHSMEQVWSWIEGFDNRRKITDTLWIFVIASLKALWDARNDKLFKNNIRSKEMIFKGAQDLAFNWLSSRVSKFRLDRTTWDISPYF